MIRIIILLLLPTFALANEADTIFVIRDLTGESQIYTAADGRILSQPEKVKDNGSRDTIYIQRETTEGKDAYYIVTNTGRAEIIPIAGEKSVTFVESYGERENNGVWTIWLDKMHEDGSFLVVWVRTKRIGPDRLVGSLVLSGRAYGNGGFTRRK
jgi:hypothetical protein